MVCCETLTFLNNYLPVVCALCAISILTVVQLSNLGDPCSSKHVTRFCVCNLIDTIHLFAYRTAVCISQLAGCLGCISVPSAQTFSLIIIVIEQIPVQRSLTKIKR